MLDIPRHNLNLLVVLDALLAERSITRAAARLHMSQPAMSAAVGRLRDWLGDPLLVRGAGGYALTTRAEELIVPLRQILEDIERTLQKPGDFDPSTAHKTFRIAANDAFELVVLPPLVHPSSTLPNKKVTGGSIKSSTWASETKNSVVARL